MKILVMAVAFLMVVSCKSAVDKQIQKHQKQQLDFERADKDFEQSFKDM